MICEWCETNAGRTSKRECCILRGLAQMPANRLREYAKTLSRAEQVELRPKLIEERKRLKELGNGASNTKARVKSSATKANN